MNCLANPGVLRATSAVSRALLLIVDALAMLMMVIVLGTSASASAAAKPYTVDITHTRVLFMVSHLGFSMLPGVFRDFDVRFGYDKEHPENSTLEVTIKSASVDMFNDRLNEDLKSADFFNVDRFPTITFHSTKVISSGDNKARISGDFTMLGITKPLTFEVTLNKSGPHPAMNKDVNALGFGASGTVDRTVFGMTKYALIGKDIQFTLGLEANDAPAK